MKNMVLVAAMTVAGLAGAISQPEQMLPLVQKELLGAHIGETSDFMQAHKDCYLSSASANSYTGKYLAGDFAQYVATQQSLFTCPAGEYYSVDCERHTTFDMLPLSKALARNDSVIESDATHMLVERLAQQSCNTTKL